MKTIENRIAALEQSVRFYRIGFFSILLFASFVIFSSNNKAVQVVDKIQAKSFEVVDNNGNVLVQINKDDKGNGQVITKSSSGNNFETSRAI